MIRRTPLSAAEETVRRALTMRTTGEIRGFLTRKVQEIWPNVALVDMRR
jgi:hypothetical protein